MSKLTTPEMIEVAKEQQQAAQRLAFRNSGVATLLTEGRKTEMKYFKVSLEEAQRFHRLTEVAGANLSVLVRALLNQVCEDLGVPK